MLHRLTDLKSFRRDRVEHARLRKLMKDRHSIWQEASGVAEALEDLGRFGSGAGIETCAALSKIFGDLVAAHAFVNSWVSATAGVLSENPLAQPLAAHQRAGCVSLMRLAQRSGAELSLVCHDVRGGSRSDIASVQFTDVETHDFVLSGRAEILLAQRSSYDPNCSVETSPAVIGAGYRLTQVDGLAAKSFTRITEPLVFLRLTRPTASQRPTQQIRLADGALLGQSSGNKQASCQEVLMAVLGRMGRKDAVPAMARIAASGPDHLRWEAIRHCLSLEIEIGFDLLCKAARKQDDPLQESAAALRDQLVSSYPQLAQLESALCPA